MNSLFAPLVTLLSTVCLSSAASALTLAQLPPTLPVDGVQSDQSTDPPPTGVGFGQAFTPSFAGASALVQEVTWWGLHGPDSLGPVFDSFKVRLDGLLLGGTLSSAAVDLDGDVTTTDDVVNRYSLAVLAGPVLENGKPSLLNVLNDSDQVQWFWLFSDAGTGSTALEISGAVVAIPEPETYALLALGLGAVAFAGRSRRQKKA